MIDHTKLPSWVKIDFSFFESVDVYMYICIYVDVYKYIITQVRNENTKF